MFAALNTVEPPIIEREQARFFEKDKSWYQEHQAMVEGRVRDRLSCLSNRLGDDDWLDSEFSAADVLMVLVLRRLEGTDIVAEYRNLADYVARGEARPAYQRAFAAQAAVFTDANPGSNKRTGQ